MNESVVDSVVETTTTARADGEADTDAEGAVTGRARIDASVERGDSGVLWMVLAVAGVGALAAAVLVVAVPSVVPAPAGTGATETARSTALFLAALVGLLGLYGAYYRRDDDGDSAEAVELPSTGSAAPDDVEQRVVGDDFDRWLSGIGGRVDPGDGLEESYAADVRRELRTVLVRTLVRTTDCSRDAALEAIQEGTWTDDRRAARFLGGDAVAEPPLDVQLRDWASGEGFDRKVDATIAAIRRLDGGERE